jgi:hypothetical protein
LALQLLQDFPDRFSGRRFDEIDPSMGGELMQHSRKMLSRLSGVVKIDRGRQPTGFGSAKGGD